MSAAQIRFSTLWRREVSRFMKIKKQTLGAPLLETFLYITVFGAALGSRIKELHGIEYVVFVIPGLIMMAFVDQRLHQQLVLDPAAEIPGRDPGPALLAGLAAGAAARLLARRLHARPDRRRPDLRRRLDPRRPAGRPRPGPDPGAVVSGSTTAGSMTLSRVDIRIGSSLHRHCASGFDTVFLRIAAVTTFPVSDAATMLHCQLSPRWKQ